MQPDQCTKISSGKYLLGSKMVFKNPSETLWDWVSTSSSILFHPTLSLYALTWVEVGNTYSQDYFSVSQYKGLSWNSIRTFPATFLSKWTGTTTCFHHKAITATQKRENNQQHGVCEHLRERRGFGAKLYSHDHAVGIIYRPRLHIDSF